MNTTMNSTIFFIPLIQIAILLTFTVLGIYTMILLIKALKVYIKNNE